MKTCLLVHIPFSTSQVFIAAVPRTPAVGYRNSHPTEALHQTASCKNNVLTERGETVRVPFISGSENISGSALRLPVKCPSWGGEGEGETAARGPPVTAGPPQPSRCGSSSSPQAPVSPSRCVCECHSAAFQPKPPLLHSFPPLSCLTKHEARCRLQQNQNAAGTRGHYNMPKSGCRQQNFP